MTEEEDEPEYGVTVIEPLVKVDPLTVTNASPKRYIVAALGAEFDVRAARSKTLQERPPFKSGANAGVARPPMEAEHLWVLGRVARKARFKLYFANNRFDCGWVWDAAGWPTQLWYDYDVGARERKQVKDEPAWAWQERIARLDADIQRRGHEYNDGEFWTNTRDRLVTTGEALDEWFADLVPGFTVRKKAVRKPKQSELEAKELLAVGEWVG